MVEIQNTTRNQVLSRTATLANTLAARTKGLLGRDGLNEGEALIIDPCNSIHTFFMRFPIDVAFVDSSGVIVRQIENMKPWRMSGIYFRARRVVEFPAGLLEATATREGDMLRFVEVREGT